MNVYLFMGTHLSELARCLADLADVAASPEPVLEFVPEGLKWANASSEIRQLQDYDPDLVGWRFDPERDLTVFIVLDPRRPQIPQLEKLAAAFQESRLEPVKVVTCVDMTVAESSPQYCTWLEANIYYSDIVLLGNRSQSAKSFLREFQKSYERKCYPCQFLLLKGTGSPDRPLEILAPFTRRLAQLFDLPEPEENLVPGVVVEASCDLDLEEPEIDPYRHSEEKEGETPPSLPDVSKWVVEST